MGLFADRLKLEHDALVTREIAAEVRRVVQPICDTLNVEMSAQITRIEDLEDRLYVWRNLTGITLIALFLIAVYLGYKG